MRRAPSGISSVAISVAGPDAGEEAAKSGTLARAGGDRQVDRPGAELSRDVGDGLTVGDALQ